MKIIKRNISAKDGSGSIMLRPENPEDLWHAYNLLQIQADYTLEFSKTFNINLRAGVNNLLDENYAASVARAMFKSLAI